MPGLRDLLPPPDVRVARRKTYDVSQRRVERFDLGDEILQIGLEGVRGVVYELVGEEVDAQVRIDNEPTEVRVDGAIGRDIDTMQRTLSVRFGLIDARPAMLALRSIVEKETGVAHRWIVLEGGSRLQEALAGGGPVLMGLQDRLLLVSGSTDLVARNVFEKFGLDDLRDPGPREPGGRKEGFVARASRLGEAAIAPDFHTAAVGARGRTGDRPSQFSVSRGRPRTVYYQGTWAWILRRSLRTGRRRSGRRR